MKSILERALVHLLNEENDKAEELLHQFVIETARNIHETLREGDECELDNEEIEEGFFGEDDLDAGEDAGEAEADLGDDLGAEVPAEAEADDLGDDTLDGEAMGDDVGDDLGGDVAAEGGDIETEIENFEQELADLQSKFDAMLAEIEGEDDVADGDDMGGDDLGDDMGGDDVADEGSDDLGAEDLGGEDDAEFSDEDLVKEGAEDEEFDDITESVVDELQKVAAIEAEGKGATGQDLLGNKTSTKFNKPAAGASRLSSTARVGHTGHAREASPSVAPLKGGKTTAAGAKNVRANGDLATPDTGKGAAIRKPAPDAANAKGPISGKNVGGKK